MAMLTHGMQRAGQGEIRYELLDLTPPWVETPETVLFHHGIATTADVWAYWLPVLLPHYRVLRFDLRGFGGSIAAARGHDWTLDAMYDDALAVADATGVHRFHMVGESAGGTVALHAAAVRPERLLSVCAVSCTHRGTPIRRVRDSWIDEMRHGLDDWSAEMMAKRFHPGALSGRAHDWFQREQAAGDVDAVLGVAQLLIDTDLTAALKEIQLPVLLLAPDGSPFVDAAIAAEMLQLIPEAELQVFQHARHGLALSHGRSCAEAYSDFLVRRAPAG